MKQNGRAGFCCHNVPDRQLFSGDNKAFVSRTVCQILIKDQFLLGEREKRDWAEINAKSLLLLCTQNRRGEWWMHNCVQFVSFCSHWWRVRYSTSFTQWEFSASILHFDWETNLHGKNERVIQFRIKYLLHNRNSGWVWQNPHIYLTFLVSAFLLP